VSERAHAAGGGVQCSTSRVDFRDSSFLSETMVMLPIVMCVTLQGVSDKVNTSFILLAILYSISLHIRLYNNTSTVVGTTTVVLAVIVVVAKLAVKISSFIISVQYGELFLITYKKAQLTQGLRATARHSKMAAIPRWPSAAILDIIEPEIAPFDPLIPKTLA